MTIANSTPAAPMVAAVSSRIPRPGPGRRAPEEAGWNGAYSPEDRGMETCCQPFRNPRTSVSLYRR
jgi:hypothetical protein